MGGAHCLSKGICTLDSSAQIWVAKCGQESSVHLAKTICAVGSVSGCDPGDRAEAGGVRDGVCKPLAGKK